MFYRKNIYAWEQWGRVVIGLAMLGWGMLASGGGLVGYGIATVGVLLGLTGLVGFCPACALVGRKLQDHK